MQKKFTIIVAIAIVLVSQLAMPSNALALLREHHQSPGVLRYHVQHSIKDRAHRAWQVILFPETDEGSSSEQYYLRLVGFPDLVEISHPQPLEIITSQGAILSAPDVFAEVAPAVNVAQYDLTESLPLLPSQGSLTLVLATTAEGKAIENISLKITPSILSEWQILRQQSK